MMGDMQGLGPFRIIAYSLEHDPERLKRLVVGRWRTNVGERQHIITIDLATGAATYEVWLVRPDESVTREFPPAIPETAPQ